MTEQFYEDKTSGITIENNSGTNKLRFDIKAKIMDDTGDGVNEVRTFCFDWTLLKGQYNHSVKFIFMIADWFQKMTLAKLLQC